MTTPFIKHVAATRFTPPRIGAKHVPRTDLLAQLHLMQHAVLALVTGSAGYGKTTLLAQWRQACVKAGADVAWLTLTAEEKGYADFCATLVASLRRVGLCAETDFPIDDASTSAMDAAIAAIVESALDWPKELYLFVDDYHYVEAPLAHRLVQKLLDQAPGNLHVVIASRVAPPLSLSRLRMMNQIVELDSAELPFSLAETRAFIDENLGAGRLDADAAGLIHELTSGWPSCIQLIVIMLKNRPDTLATLRDLVWRSSDLQTWLSEEVMADLPAQLASFAEVMSIFRRFNAPLARAVTGDPQAADLLKRMEDENLLVSRVDSDDRLAWYCLHPLFGEYLATRLVARDDAAVKELHLRASRWFAEHGYLAEAVRHASTGGDVEFAATVIERAEPTAWSLEYLSPMLHLLEQLPEATLFRHQRLLFIACLTIALTTRPDKASAWLAHLQSGALPDDPELAACVPMIHAAIAFQHDDTQRMVELLEPMRDVIVENRFLRYFFVAELCVSYAGTGRYADVTRLLDLRPIPSTDRDDEMALVVEAAHVAAILAEGDAREAERLGTPLLARSVKAVGRHSISSNICASVLVDAYYELDRIDDARETIANRRGLLQSSGPDLTIRASLCRARLDCLQVSADVALTFLEQQTAHLRDHQQPRPVAYMLAEQIRILLQKNRHARAAQLDVLLDELAQAHRDDRGIRAEIAAIGALAHARVLRAAQPEAALASLRDAHARASALGRRRLAALADFLLAATLVDLELIAQARDSFLQAIGTGTRFGLVRTFIDEGATAATLLNRAVEEAWIDGAAHDYVVGLLDRFPRELDKDGSGGVSRRAVGRKGDSALTPRELEILALVAQAMSNKRIALALNITLETVKWNLRNVFAKLGVSSRYDAMLWARKNGLIE
ncbi:helix-turn-helix transcriptional regulator [Paraburkholderia monticola]|uniref:Helix-turn-helix transcriptional regulator n=1 Tax=Paraburkholderia monticola TaxID=1399968 RepID=A0A149PD68_9BURK|nr:LuxR C-terminal-related transcriptional regulator [Paraburkholderia monticola]KXU82958.1 helix-turn-helix transcriptional regulator [Paraburkholderia monticola]